MPAVSRSIGRLLGMRAHRLLPAPPPVPPSPDRAPDVAVVGGGIAGVSAAAILAERGIPVVVYEADERLGGRLSARPHTLPDGTVQQVDHGFHGFFRQYYNWRNLLRRIDTAPSRLLHPLDSYPVISTCWPPEQFDGLPPTPPLSILALLARSPSLRLRELRRADQDAGRALLGFDARDTYRRLDGVPAEDLLARLGLSARARSMLFNVFAHSFFNEAATMSAAELVAMFHFYFLANPDGLGMDAPHADYEQAIWQPFAEYLRRYGVTVRTGTPVTRVRSDQAGRWTVDTPSGADAAVDELVLAVDAASAGTLLAASPDARDADRRLASVACRPLTGPPYAVARYWLDGDVDPGRAPFTSIGDPDVLDSVTAYHRIEQGARRWHGRTGGAVLELHAYACPDGVSGAELGERMRAELAVLWPEVGRLGVVDARFLVGRDAAGFPVGGHAVRPAVRTGAPHLWLAGDWVATPFPSALMERAAATGMLAANAVLTAYGHPPEPVWSVPPRGLLAGRAGRSGAWA